MVGWLVRHVIKCENSKLCLVKTFFFFFSFSLKGDVRIFLASYLADLENISTLHILRLDIVNSQNIQANPCPYEKLPFKIRASCLVLSPAKKCVIASQLAEDGSGIIHFQD